MFQMSRIFEGVGILWDVVNFYGVGGYECELVKRFYVVGEWVSSKCRVFLRGGSNFMGWIAIKDCDTIFS